MGGHVDLLGMPRAFLFNVMWPNRSSWGQFVVSDKVNVTDFGVCPRKVAQAMGWSYFK